MTKTCINCGREISEEQHDNYQGFCTQCLQAEFRRMGRNDELPYTTCRYCSNPAMVTCSICGKPLCASHIMVHKNDPNPAHGRCRDCVPRRTYVRTSSGNSDARTIYCVCKIVVLIIILIGTIIGIF